MDATSRGAPDYTIPVDTMRRENGLGKWVQATLLIATGVAITLWVCQRDSSVTANNPTWLFQVIVAASWPAYLTWRYCTRASRAERARAAFQEGYADGYLRGWTDALDSPVQRAS